MPKESRLTENSVVNLQRIVVLQTVVIGVMAFLFRTGCAPVTLL